MSISFYNCKTKGREKKKKDSFVKVAKCEWMDTKHVLKLRKQGGLNGREIGPAGKIKYYSKIMNAGVLNYQILKGEPHIISFGNHCLYRESSPFTRQTWFRSDKIHGTEDDNFS